MRCLIFLIKVVIVSNKSIKSNIKIGNYKDYKFIQIFIHIYTK